MKEIKIIKITINRLSNLKIGPILEDPYSLCTQMFVEQLIQLH